MTRLDQECGNFEKFAIILKAQTDIQSILRETMTSTDSRINNISEILEKTHAAIKDDYQAYGIFNNAFALNNTFNQWINNLPQGQKKLFNIFLVTMLPPIEKQERIPLAELGYKSKNYKEATKSNWLKTQEGLDLTAEQKAVAELIEEFVRQERANISNAASTTSVFFELLNDTRVTSADKNVLRDYLELLSEQRAAYDNLNLHELLSPENRSIESVAAALCERYQGADYKTYQDTLEDMIPMLNKVESILTKYQHLNVNPSLAVITQQRAIPALYHGLFNRLATAVKKADIPMEEILNRAIITAQKRKASADAIYDASRFMHGLGNAAKQVSTREKAVFKHFINSPYATLPRDLYQQHLRGVFLESMLVEAQPSIFEKMDRGLKVVGKRAQAIYNALGGKPVSGSSLDPYSFRAAQLDALGNEPIWKVLKAMKPIDEQFTLLNKVQAYSELIRLAKAGKLKISDQSSIDQAREIAQKILDMVNTRIREVPQEDTPELVAVMRDIYQTIRASTMTHTFAGKYTPVERAYKEFRDHKKDIHEEELSQPVKKVEGEGREVEADHLSTKSLSSSPSHTSLKSGGEQVVDLPDQDEVEEHQSTKSRSRASIRASIEDDIAQDKTEEHLSIKSRSRASSHVSLKDEEPLNDQQKQDEIEEHIAELPIVSTNPMEDFDEILNEKMLKQNRSKNQEPEEETDETVAKQKMLLKGVFGDIKSDTRHKGSAKRFGEMKKEDDYADHHASVFAAIRNKTSSNKPTTVIEAQVAEHKKQRAKESDAEKKPPTTAIDTMLKTALELRRGKIEGKEDDEDDFDNDDNKASKPL